ncbi:hypothetical protein BC939DRAFT_100141 [Gamsiella multidivaricata]|uniref:uncharacterized protein n=1 Tax=Gamsiella multidivaricata TaxID=101098 RepID=UPI002220E4E3|nr:uncharacterized protein BC939DRAFT_100141 [Gamsiella multidivaricata]KAI7832290.1 hypothetical protein BC939DRAFT_100141 [Gamsiella multidivaricata]
MPTFISWPRSVAVQSIRTFSRAVYEPELGLFRLTVNKGTHFVSMGHTLHGQIYLYPEEALYLVDRGSLLVDHHGVDMSVQHMWSIYLSPVHIQSQDGRQHQDQDKDAPIPQDSTTAMNRYLTYAYLKRLGFVVIRPGTYRHEVVSRTHGQSKAWGHELTRPLLKLGPLFTALWDAIVGTWWRRSRAFITNVGLGLLSLIDMWSGKFSRPLVSNNDQLQYGQILDKLKIIPSVRLAHTSEPSVQAMRRLQIGRENNIVVDFEVYKPAGAFKKRQPGTPDYHVVVVGADAMLPSLGELEILMDGQPDPAQENPSSTNATNASEKDKRKRAPDWPKVLYAIVDGGQVSFMKMFNIQATP